MERSIDSKINRVNNQQKLNSNNISLSKLKNRNSNRYALEMKSIESECIKNKSINECVMPIIRQT